MAENHAIQVAAAEVFPVELGGRRWELPRLPFRVVRKIHPLLMRQARALTGADDKERFLLTESDLAEQTEIVAMALKEVDPGVSALTLDGLIFTIADLSAAQLAVARAIGIPVAAAADAASPAAPIPVPA